MMFLDTSASSDGSGVIVVLIGLAIYFVPSLVAYNRRVLNRAPIFVINLFLGWTFIGWVVALAMAVSRNVEPPSEPPGESRFPWVNWMNRR
jgi:cytochrome c biogenesis protein CcdA